MEEILSGLNDVADINLTVLAGILDTTDTDTHNKLTFMLY